MTTRIERIREALCRLGLPIKLNTRSHEAVEESYENWLTHFLADKSWTGARIKDFGGESIMQEDWLQEAILEALCDDDPDEAIAELWQKVFIGEPGTD